MVWKLRVFALVAGLAILPALGLAQSQEDRARTKALNEALRDHAAQVRGDRMWPIRLETLPVPSGASIEQQAAEQQAAMVQRVREGDILSIKGEVRGPAGFRDPFAMTAPSGTSGVGHGLSPGNYIHVEHHRGVTQVDLLVGVAIGDDIRVASREAAPLDRPIVLAMGGGYSVSLSMEVREPNEDERRFNEELARAIERSVAEGPPIPLPPVSESDAPPPVIYRSPFSNSVIREGDPRSRNLPGPAD